MENMTCGEAFIGLIKSYGVDTVFGIPGVHTLEFYRGLDRHGIRHIVTRHEQGAAFMADGYARATGKPGVCLVISGPGVTNAATALAEAYSDSIPVLMISAVQGRSGMGLGRGELHEISSQKLTTAPLTGFTATALTEKQVPELIARAFALFKSSRPRPVHIEVPIDILTSPANFPIEARTLPPLPAPDQDTIQSAANILTTAECPIMLIGGGAHGHSDKVVRLAEQLNAPTIHSRAAKGIMPEDHPLCLGATIRFLGTQSLLSSADVVLAIATEMAPTDHWVEKLDIRGKLVRIDIDPSTLVREYPVAAPIHGDVGIALNRLLTVLDQADINAKKSDPHDLIEQAKVTNAEGQTTKQKKHIKILNALRSALPRDAFIAADSTQLAYSGSALFPCYRDRSWFFPVGYGTLGYALPAAIGAKLAVPHRAGAVIVGDGGFLFNLGDLATAVDQQIALPIIIWNNSAYGQIKDDMIDLGHREIGVDLKNPDFINLGKSFGCKAYRPINFEEFKETVCTALSHQTPTIIEICEDAEFL